MCSTTSNLGKSVDAGLLCSRLKMIVIFLGISNIKITMQLQSVIKGLIIMTARNL